MRRANHLQKRIKGEKGNIMILAFMGMVIMMMVGMLAVDNGIQYTIRQDIRSTAEAAALGGAQRLDETAPAARLEALRFALYNGFRGDVLVGAFINPELLTAAGKTSAANCSDTELVNLVYNTLVNNQTDTFVMDNFARVPLTSFQEYQINGLFGQLTATLLGKASAGPPWSQFADSAALTAHPDPNRAMNLVIVTPFQDVEARNRGIDKDGTIAVIIEEYNVDHFAKHFNEYYSKKNALSVAINNNTSEVIQLNWDLEANGDIHSTPVLYNQYLYVSEASTGNNGKVMCVRTDSGVPVWSFETATGTLRTYDQSLTPPTGSSTMNWWDANGLKHPLTNYVAYAHGSGSHNVQTTATLGKGNIYVEATNGYVYCLDALTGIPQWQYLINNYSNSKSVQLTSGSKVRTSGWSSNLWTNGSPVAYNKYLFVPSSGYDGHRNSLVVLPLEYPAGGLMPESQASVYALGSEGGADTNHASKGQVNSTPVVIDVHPLWKQSAGGIVPDQYETLAMMGSTDGYFYCVGVDLDTAKPTMGIVWLYDCGQEVTGNPRYYDGAVYIGDNGDDVMKFLVNPVGYQNEAGQFLWNGAYENKPRWVFDTTNFPREYNSGVYGRHSTTYANYHNGILVTEKSGQRVLYFGDSYGYAYGLVDKDEAGVKKAGSITASDTTTLLWDTKPDENTVRIESTPAYRYLGNKGYVFFGARTMTSGYGGTGLEGGTSESGSKGGYFFSLNALTGEVTTLYPIDDDTHGSMIVDGDRLYYAGCDRKVYSYQFSETVSSEEAYIIR